MWRGEPLAEGNTYWANVLLHWVTCIPEGVNAKRHVSTALCPAPHIHAPGYEQLLVFVEIMLLVGIIYRQLLST